MRQRSLLLSLLLGVPLLAGCLGTSSDEPDLPFSGSAVYDAIEAAIGSPVVADHDHADPSLHRASYNLELVARVNGHEDGSARPPTEFYAETAVKGGYAYLTRYGPQAGLVIFDVSDVEAPRQVGYLQIHAGFEPDVEVSDDGDWAFFETQRFPVSAETPNVLSPGANLPRGVHIVDVSDKASPTWAGWSPTPPDGPHSITYAEIDGRHILFQSVYAFAYAYGGVQVPTAQRLVVSELDTSGPVATLRTLAEYVDPDAERTGSGLFPHDVSVSVHPVTGRTLAYVAYWDVGVVILDVTDPENPVRVGVANDFGPARYREVHMARAFPHLIDGRVICVVEPEIGEQPDSGYVTFVDVTDPAKPEYVSSWLIPGNLSSGGGSLGPHYFDVADGRVALASYHAGYWVIDVHDKANLERPRTVAFALTDAVGEATTLFGAAPSAFDAWWYEGHVVVGDINGGLGVYRYTGPAPGPDEAGDAPWTAAAAEGP